MDLSAYLGLTYFLSELLLTVTRRSSGTGVKQDRSTLRVLWLVILLSIAAAVSVARYWRAGALPRRDIFALGVTFFVSGLMLRWWAILELGRFFTVDVQIARDHHIVDTGPFRLVRHPSYSGVLLAFVGVGLSLANWAAVLVLLLPIFAAFLRRMNVEEEALRGALGESYVRYMQRTKRLVPGVY